MSVFVHDTTGQSYTPRADWSKGNSDIIKSLKRQADLALEDFDRAYRLEASGIVKRRLISLSLMVQRGGVIRDDDLQQWVNSIFDRVLSANSIELPHYTLLILKSPYVNAYCYGEGTFAVTTGLLSKMKSDDALAFVLAHELAHYQLSHVKKRIIKSIEANRERKKKNLSFETLETAEDVQRWQKDFLELMQYGRDLEMEADVAALQLMRNAGYLIQGAEQALHALDSAGVSGLDMNQALRHTFSSARFPFQEYWLKPRLSIYGKSNAPYLFFYDSASHPDIGKRIEAIKTRNEYPAIASSPRQQSSYLHELASFERIESAYFNKLADWTIWYALQQLAYEPGNDYVVSRISQVFIELLAGYDEFTNPVFIPSFTQGYSTELKLVNSFLHNLTKAEMGEIAFQFLNNQTNFNPESEAHYYLLWKICDLTNRSTVREKIKEMYKEKYPEGKYYSSMKSGLTLKDIFRAHD